MNVIWFKGVEVRTGAADRIREEPDSLRVSVHSSAEDQNRALLDMAELVLDMAELVLDMAEVVLDIAEEDIPDTAEVVADTVLVGPRKAQERQGRAAAAAQARLPRPSSCSSNTKHMR